MKKISFLLLIISLVTAVYADENLRKAAILPDTNFYINGDIAVMKNSPLNAECEAIMNGKGPQEQYNGGTAKEVKETMKEYADLKAALDKFNDLLSIELFAAIRKIEHDDDGPELKDASFSAYLQFKEKHSLKQLADSLAGVKVDDDPIVTVPFKVQGVNGMQIKCGDEDEILAIVFDKEGTGALLCTKDVLPSILTRAQNKQFLGLPAEINDCRASLTQTSHFLIAYAFPAELNAAITVKAAKAANKNPLEAAVLSQLTETKAAAMAILYKDNGVTMELALLQPNPEKATAIKNNIFDGMLKPMVGMMAVQMGQQMDIANALQNRVTGSNAVLSAFISKETLFALIKTM